MKKQNRIGIDLGGTKIEGVTLGPDGAIRDRRRAATPRAYAATIEAIAGLVAALEGGGGPLPVGVGIPGSPSPATGLIRNANSTWLNGRPLGADLSAALAREVRLANDANCFALSEATDGAGAGANSVFGVILGTGVGGGIVIDGRIVHGAVGVGGEWGHTPLPWMSPQEHPGRDCWCGRTGCIETWLSGPGWTAWDDFGRTPQEIVEAAAAGDASAERSLARYADRLGRALGMIVSILDPEVIVLGGGLSNIDALYDLVPQVMARWAFSDTVATRIVRNAHGDSSGVRGAAWLWPSGRVELDVKGRGSLP